MFDHVVANGPGCVKAVADYWLAKEIAGKVTRLQQEVRDQGLA
jgi:hypothetical protein